MDIRRRARGHILCHVKRCIRQWAYSLTLYLLNEVDVSITITFHRPWHQGCSPLLVTFKIVDWIELNVGNFLASKVSIFRNLLMQKTLIDSICVLGRTPIACNRYVSGFDIANCTKFFVEQGFSFGLIDLLARIVRGLRLSYEVALG